MTQPATIVPMEQVLRERPHLAFVIECLGLASLAENVSHEELRGRLGRCLKSLGSGCRAAEIPSAALVRWLDQAMQEFSSLQEGDFSSLLAACVGNTMPEWLKKLVMTELGDAVSELITRCLEC